MTAMHHVRVVHADQLGCLIAKRDAEYADVLWVDSALMR